MLKKALDKLSRFMGSEKSVRILVMGGLAGLICILLSSWIPASDNTENSDSDKQSSQTLKSTIEDIGLSEESLKYAELLENRLEDMLSQIDGVGSCSVMLTVSGSASYSYAQNAEQQISENAREIKQQHVILDEKIGDSALIECTKNPEVIGVIIACEGGEHNVVRENIISAVGAVLDIPSNRICVTKKITESEE